MTCGRCGAANAPGAKFCNNCGNVLAPAGQMPPPGQSVPPVRPLPTVTTAEQAKLALILGMMSWVLCGFPTGIPAVLVGRKAIRQIRQSQGRLKGEEIALAGVIMGYASCAIWLVFLIGGYLMFRTAEKQTTESEASVVSTIQQVNAAEASYARIYGGSSGHLYANSLAALGPGPSGTCVGSGTREYACLMKGPLVEPDCREPHWCILNDYKFQIQTHYSSSSRDTDYAISATPIEGRGGSKHFCSTGDGVVRSADFFIFSLDAGYDPETCHRLKPIEKRR
ncbi:MAG TPA: DUF4190 domain-containing protein [Candidatus Angelobacter sp.]|nr:DUF4190 domain-containing protein [Candidatus Angelobacter sp.]